VGWLEDFRSDVRRCAAAGHTSAWKSVLLEPGLWALLEYRLEAALARSSWPRLLRLPARIVFAVWSRLIQAVTGISLPATATIGPGLRIPHAGTIVLHARTVIGRDCCLTHGVTIGISGSGERRGVPRLGDRVYVGANASVVGPVRVGNDVVVGANSLVNRDVPDHCTVVGVPASVVSQKGSEEYL
jgi:serine O-acetyltransferase